MTGHNHTLHTSLAFSLEHTFPDSESINFRVFYHLDRMRISETIKSCSFVLIALPSTYLFPLHFLLFSTLLRNLS